MKFGSMLGDVGKSLVKKPATEQYPFMRREVPRRLRGQLTWDRENCTGCSLCAKDCPADALEMVVIDKKTKRFVMRYHVDRCTFCSQCVSSCNQDCLSMNEEEWELAALTRDQFETLMGSDEDVTYVLADIDKR